MNIIYYLINYNFIKKKKNFFLKKKNLNKKKKKKKELYLVYSLYSYYCNNSIQILSLLINIS